MKGNVMQRRIGKHRYVIWFEYKQKSKAKSEAVRLRKQGCLTRVLPMKRTQWGKRGYAVYKNLSCKVRRRR